MGLITNLTMRHADAFLTAVGALGGGSLLGFNLGVEAGVVGAVCAAVITIALSKIEPLDPALGPHQ